MFNLFSTDKMRLVSPEDALPGRAAELGPIRLGRLDRAARAEKHGQASGQLHASALRQHHAVMLRRTLGPGKVHLLRSCRVHSRAGP